MGSRALKWADRLAHALSELRSEVHSDSHLIILKGHSGI
ncbi:hypothetical protein SS05631_a45680 (plasmid) [Sinorhizobium sp. CCBAU 05631]|nr:hypothetical protein SS05631_a45680 [Sinorhizobium sp. CCBAU 05631]AWI62124.1 hypothetical protein AB395_00004600 [Sinorhizobium fredii CCBAU 45436]AWM30054.1 hypothetical protein AOX55_00004620 [Sinorhizobium fredii CCBAU 25509]CCE98822.1 hypothetical protein SFHH103_04342 [Sinorhizobium fredii HH103]CEO91503.1 hypothetical protein SFHH103_psfHH103d_305 [Sinorhizobium fredii HH103]